MKKSITSIVFLVVHFSGCGEKSDTQSIDNSGLQSNELGYYGKDAIFGAQKLLDKWVATFTSADTNESKSASYIFRSDGVFSSDATTSFSYGYYGVDADGHSIALDTFSLEGMIYTLKMKVEREDGCIETEALNQNKSVFAEVLLCPAKIDNTALYAGVNLGKKIGELGYYGDNVVFGSKTVTGEWKIYSIDENDTVTAFPNEKLFLRDDGTGTISNAGGSCLLECYGVNEDGSELYGYSIVKELNTSCFEVKSDTNNTNVMCKTE